ncbi:MAG: PepSY domain-containing protein [Alphaproteobacteria bacterium]|nr:PepSY domain-containing protein [Alphaproteobacteria bacterium]
MKTPVFATTLAAAFLAASGLAYAASSQNDVALEGAEVGTYLGKTEAEGRAALEAKGFVVTEGEVEDDELEFGVKKDGQAYEIEVDPGTGKISETEKEDDND